MERIFILIKDFPTSLLRFLLFSSEAKQIEMAFFSSDKLEDASMLLKQTKTVDSNLVSCVSSPVNHATKYIFCFSALGKKING